LTQRKVKTFGIADLSKWNDGEYVVEISSTDKDGQAVHEISYFTVFAPTSNQFPLRRHVLSAGKNDG